MHPNEQLIKEFYTAFSKKDYKTMQACYADNAQFSDPVFTNLNADEVRAMWEMFCTSGREMKIEHSKITADENTGSAEWIATYSFSATGNKVVNRIKANFVFADGKIVQHTDVFDFHKWAKQALGTTGLLLGWTSFLRNKVRKTAKNNLDNFISKKTNRKAA